MVLKQCYFNTTLYKALCCLLSYLRVALLVLLLVAYLRVPELCLAAALAL